MAVTFVAAVADEGNSATRSVTIPGTAAVDDLAFLFLDRGAAETAATPAGWTLFGSTSAASLTTTVWRKKLVSGDPGATVTVTNVTSGKSVLTLSAYRGVDPNSLIEDGQSTFSNASSTTRVSPTVNTAVDQDWVIEHITDKSSAAGTAWTVPGSRTRRSDKYETGSGAITTVTADSNTGLSPGAHGALTYTETAAGASAVMWTLAVKPAPTAPTGPPNIAKTNSTTSSLTLQLTTTAGAVAGDLLVGAVGFDADHITLPTLNVTDDAGNTWTVGATDNNGASEGLAIFTTTVTTGFSAGSHILLTVDNARHLWAVTVDNYTGLTSPGIGQASTHEGFNTTISTGATPTLGQSGELAVMAVAWHTTTIGEAFTPDAGWTATSNAHTSTGGTDVAVSCAYQTVPGTAGVTGTGTIPAASTYEAGVVTFRDATVNRPPTANAGPDQSVSPGQTVELDGTASSDIDGTITTFAWTQTAGTAVTLSSTAVATPTFTAPTAVAGTTLAFHLVVTDNLAATGTDDVNVVVTPASTVFHREAGVWVPKTLLERVAGVWQ